MRIIFFGTSIFAVPSLKALTKADHDILLVVTQPDRKKGRHLHLTPPPIKEIAASLALPVYQPTDASTDASIEQLRRYNADLFVVVSFGQILSKAVLLVPKKFAVNLHASLLPKYRGAAPINWAIINGEKKTGVSIFKLEKRMDAGDIILEEEIGILDEDSAITLSEKLSKAGAELLVKAIDLVEKDKVVFKKQDESLVSFAPKLKKTDGLLDWNLSAIELHNRIRGLLPWPGAFTTFKGKKLNILEAEALPCESTDVKCGQIVKIEANHGILIRAKEGCLAIKKLQPESSRPMVFEEFLRGHRLVPGDILR